MYEGSNTRMRPLGTPGEGHARPVAALAAELELSLLMRLVALLVVLPLLLVCAALALLADLIQRIGDFRAAR